uniref:GYF domain-containing protein n=1 Tax=Pygocentrus nattereri TaxID=42514 RepID=A0AAR2LDY0_PYGNA
MLFYFYAFFLCVFLAFSLLPHRLRALSSGGSVTSPPPSPAMPKYKLAEYRYGREEMLALYIKDNKVPEDMQDKEFAAILQDEPQQPLALVPLTEEEQRNFSMSVNSVAVLRLMGKGGGATPTGIARGRGSVRGGRGRGRGEGGFYQRSTEDGEVGFSRSVREIHRSQSWDDRGERRFEKPLRREGLRVGFEEVGSGGRKEYMRSDSDNWRTLREEHEQEDTGDIGGSWRLAGSRRDDGGPRSAGWREHSEVRRRKFDFDFRDGGSEGGRRRAGSEGAEEERDGLPEWCTDEEDGEMGTFDSSGAFMSIKKGSKDPIPEEEYEFQGLEDEEECSMDGERKNSSGGEKPERVLSEPLSELSPSASSSLPSSPPSSSSAATDLPPSGGDPEDDEGMKHLQQEAEKMVAALQDTSLEEECFTQTLQENRNTAAALPLSHDSAMKWFYKDPQGEIQGPFTTVEMCEWFQAGYFSMSLLVKRGCDEGFQPLGDVIKMWGRVPFAPGPSPPPLCNLDQERLKKQQELAAAAALYQQLQQQQLFQLINRCGEQGMMPSMNRSMSVPDTGSMWDMHTSASQPTGGEASIWDLTQGPTLEQLQKLQERREAELRAKREEEERKRRDEKRRQQEEQKRREEEELFRRKQWGAEGVGALWGSGALEGKAAGGSSPSGGSMGIWDEALKNQSALRNSMGLKNSRSSPSLSDQYMMINRRKRTEEEERLLKLLQGMKAQDGFTTWCEQMLHALNTSANNSSSSQDVATIVAYLKEVESPYEVLDFIRHYLGDTVEAKEFAKQFLERRAKQKANHQRQQQQVCLSKEVAGLTMNSFPLQSMFQSVHSGKGGMGYDQAGKLKKKQPMILHSDPSILGTRSHSLSHSNFSVTSSCCD